MGVIKRGILGGFSGRVANVVGGSWKGIAYMRALPLSVANPNTPAQQTVREAFTTAVECGKQLVAVLMPVAWNPFAERKSGFNAFVGVNSKIMAGWETTTWANVIMSEGKIPQPSLDVATYDTATGDVELEWSLPAGWPAAYDNAKCFASNVKKKLKSAICVDTLETADALAASINMGLGLEAGDVFDCWITFVSDDGKDVSNSEYKATILIP